jgi:hypothetical protein
MDRPAVDREAEGVLNPERAADVFRQAATSRVRPVATKSLAAPMADQPMFGGVTWRFITT